MPESKEEPRVREWADVVASGRWQSPSELVAEGFSCARVVMVNEAHSGIERCIRTRLVGRHILPAAHECGVRHLAMEALHPREWVTTANRTRSVPPRDAGYLSQPEMRELVGDALALGWTLWPFEADFDSAPADIARQRHTPSVTFTNWRMFCQGRNLAGVMTGIPSDERLLVWCGWSHGSKARLGGVVPMGVVFGELTGLQHFFIDQTITVRPRLGSSIVEDLRPVLQAQGGTAGLLRQFAGPLARNLDADAFIFSLDNDFQ